MNKKSHIIIVVVVLLLIGGAAIVMSAKKKPVTIDNGGVNVQETAKKDSPKTLKDLLSSGVAQKCTYEDTIEGSNIEGTSYISGGKVRADFTTKTGDNTSSGHTIYDGKTSYIWMDGTKTGFKMEINPQETQAQPQNSTRQGVDMNKSIDYKCSIWVADQSQFTPPSDVTFSGFAAPTGTQGSQTQGSQNMCASCNSLSGDQKTQCLSALNCK